MFYLTSKTSKSVSRDIQTREAKTQTSEEVSENPMV